MKARLAIVGTRTLGCPGDRAQAAERARQAIERLQPAVVISGGADGVDRIAEQVAQSMGYTEPAGTLIVCRATVRRFHGVGGFQERDEQIAQACTHLLRIFCGQAKTWGSGWTAQRAEALGKVVVRHCVCPRHR